MVPVSPGQTVEQRALDVVAYELALTTWNAELAGRPLEEAVITTAVVRGAGTLKAEPQRASKATQVVTVSGGQAGSKYEVLRTVTTRAGQTQSAESRTLAFRVRVVG